MEHIQRAHLGFEEMSRGPEQLVTERQRFYLSMLGESAPVLDIGCGRGELLDLLAEVGVDARGVDTDPDMVARCRAKGHDVELADGVDFLEAQPDGSVGAIFSAQVVEHLGFQRLFGLFSLALRKLRRGGLLLAETVNPHSLPAFRAFWVDPSHVGPLFPETLVALCCDLGFAETSVVFPLGQGSLDEDLRTACEYAVVARAPERE